MENNVFYNSKTTNKKKKERKSLFLEYFKVKFIVKILKLVKLLWISNKNFVVYLSMWYTLLYVGLTLLISALLDIAFLEKTCKNRKNYNRGKLHNLTFQKMEILATLDNCKTT